MANPQEVLAERVHDAIVAAFGPEYGDADPLIRPSAFADFQANAALPLANPEPTTMMVYFRLLAGFTSFISNLRLSQAVSIGPDGSFEFSSICV